MTDYTRRSHIVRVSLDNPPTPDGKKPSRYVDVEVLDAIAFRTENGKEVILNNPAASSVPYIVDNTGDGNGKTPGQPTQLTHMKRLVGSDDPTQMLDVEIMDCMAFRDQNGDEWILDMLVTSDAPDVFDTTDGSGDASATRRVHEEIITSPFGTSINANPKPSTYLTVQRMDAIAFRKVLGDEVIFVCPSSDDPNSSGTRASTFTWSPSQTYDPADTSSSAVVPPTNSDPHVYVAMPSASMGFNLKDTKIAQGPFWWIRSISGGNVYLLITVTAGKGNPDVAPPIPSISVSPQTDLIIAEDPVTTQGYNPGLPISTVVYFVWISNAEFPTASTYSVKVGDGLAYGTQFSQQLNLGLGGFETVSPPGSTFGAYGSLAGAEAGAAWLNARFTMPNIIEWYGPTGALLGPATLSGFTVGQLTLTTTEGGFGSSTIAQKFLYGPFPPGDDVTYTVAVGGADSSGVQGQLYIGVPGTVKTVDDLVDETGTAGGAASGGADTSAYTVEAVVGSQGDGSDSSVTVTGNGGGGGGTAS